MRKRFVLGLVAVILLVATAELGLQLLALRARAGFTSERGGGVSDDALRILCVGDSHTYGASIPREGAYPHQLEARLASRLAPRPVSVVNGGFPGINTAFVALRLEQRIAETRPHIVLIWAGTNNRWNRLETDSWENGGFASRIERVLLHSKLYRLAKVLRETDSTGPETDPDAPIPTADGMPWERRAQELADAELARGTRHDMEAMVETTRAAGVPIVFITYPLADMADINALVAHNAHELGAPVVATAHDYARARRAGHAHPELIIYASGPHPTGLLYGYVAESLEQVVVDQLGLDPASD